MELHISIFINMVFSFYMYSHVLYTKFCREKAYKSLVLSSGNPDCLKLLHISFLLVPREDLNIKVTRAVPMVQSFKVEKLCTAKA